MYSNGEHAHQCRKYKYRQILLVFIVFIIVIISWEYLIFAFKMPDYILPAPSAIAQQLYQLLFDNVLFWKSLKMTLYAVIFGYLLGVISSLILGVLIAQSPMIELSIMPYMVAFQSVPSVALAPILVQWFGYGLASKIIMSAIISLFPMLVNTLAGLHAPCSNEISMLKIFGASKWQIFLQVKIPVALPFIFEGLKLSAVFALIGTIVAEFLGAQHGLGKMLLQFNEQFNTAGMFSIIIILAMLGTILYSVINLAKKRIIFWVNKE